LPKIVVMASENSDIKGWVLYDGDCGLCSRWVPFWESTLKKRGFRIAPLQADWVGKKFALSEQELTSDFRVLLANGERLAGAEVYRYLMRRIWWATPFYVLSVLPMFRMLFDAGYRAFADNRYWISRTCRLPANRALNIKTGIVK
jgi:predicted DCC family thiol-disulfide oxidoreductase YuxK